MVNQRKKIDPYERRGLQMVDIESYFTTLKASWVSRLTTEHLSKRVSRLVTKQLF